MQWIALYSLVFLSGVLAIDLMDHWYTANESLLGDKDVDSTSKSSNIRKGIKGHDMKRRASAIFSICYDCGGEVIIRYEGENEVLLILIPSSPETCNQLCLDDIFIGCGTARSINEVEQLLSLHRRSCIDLRNGSVYNIGIFTLNEKPLLDMKANLADYTKVPENLMTTSMQTWTVSLCVTFAMATLKICKQDHDASEKLTTGLKIIDRTNSNAWVQGGGHTQKPFRTNQIEQPNPTITALIKETSYQTFKDFEADWVGIPVCIKDLNSLLECLLNSIKERWRLIFCLLAIFGSISINHKQVRNSNTNNQYPISNITKSTKDKAMTYDDPYDAMSFMTGFGHLRLPRIVMTVNTVARYPDDHNSLLPLKLIKRLDKMNPKEFLKYVLEELTLEERESLMIDERQRRRTFQAGWPYENNLSGVKMAQAGFYSVDDYDRVQCVFCRGSLHRWERDDTPMLEHARSFNFCRFVRGLNCGNREFKPDKLTKEDMKNITSFPSADTAQSTDLRNGMADSSVYGISTNRAAMIEYAVHESRMRTFSRWPKNAPIQASLLCDAGFYFTGFDDMVRCFNCAGAIREWTTTDDPYVEHARWFPDCSYLIQVKTQEFVDEVHATTPANKKTVRKTKAQITATKKEDKLLSDQEEMYQLCLTLGHSEESIQKAFESNGGPFENVRNMIDAIYNAESGKNSPLRGNLPVAMLTEPTSCSEDIRDAYSSSLPRLQPDSTSQVVGVFNGTERHQKHQLGCRKCENRTGQYVPASHIGLPCGHVNFCDQCNNKEKQRATVDPNYRVRCAENSCGAPLTATMKVYLA